MARVIDFQHHMVPMAIARSRGFTPGSKLDYTVNGIKQVTLHDRLVDPEMQLADLDTARIDVGVLTSVTSWDASPEDCRLTNDELAAIVRRHPKRFVALAHLPLDRPEALGELKRATEELGMPGATIMSQVNGRMLDDRSLDAFYAACQEKGLPIFVHPVMRVDMHRGCEEYDLGRIIGREFDLVTAATRLIAGGVLDRFPELNFVIAHFGGGIAGVLDRIRNKAFRFGTLKRGFDEYFSRLYFDMAGYERSALALKVALAGVPSRQFVFATDYPQDFTGTQTSTGVGVAGIADYIADVQALPLSADERDAMLGGTAARLLHI